MPPIPFRTLPEALAAAPPRRPFVTLWSSEDDVQTVTFGEFHHQARAQAAYFQSLGLRRGEPVIVIMPQGIPLMTAFVAAMLLGAVPAILAYPNFKVEPTKYHSGLAGVSASLKARLVIVDDAFPSELLEHVAVHDSVRLVRGVSDESPGTPIALADALPSEPESLAFIQHSAGTTGLQKGVALSHAAVLRQLNHLATALRINDRDRIYSWLPLYHDMGLISCFMLPLVCHLPVVMQSPTNWVMQPATMLELISQHRCTLAWVPNFTLQFLARRVRPEDRANVDLSSLRALINCSEPVLAQSMDEFLTAFGSCGMRPNVLQSSYAMAENVFAVTQSRIHGEPGPHRLWVDGECLRSEHKAVPVEQAVEGAVPLVSSGPCLPGNLVRIVSPDGQDLADGTIGEILISSDSLFDGYYNRPDLSKVALKDGWFWSGDLGFRLDRELYVTGRKKDLIIVGGKNIYPQDVEEIACSHPAIHDGRAVAMGILNSDLGTEDIVVVAEVGDEGSPHDAFDIEQAVRNAIVAELGVAVRAVYLKGPKWIVKSTAGKPARSATREKLLAEHPELLQG
jgi:fatty-acyl-CoA synthase